MSSLSVNACLSVLRRTPPGNAESNIEALACLLQPKEDAVEELFQRADAPLKDAVDEDADGKPYIQCDHNRDGDSFRSPWSNSYYPPHPTSGGDDAAGFRPRGRLRVLEVRMNEAFDSYRELYYGPTNTISSVYLWDEAEAGDSDGNRARLVRSPSSASSTAAAGGSGAVADYVTSAFSGAILLKKTVITSASLERGYWNSIHIVDTTPLSAEKFRYSLTSTVLISMTPPNKEDLDTKDDFTNLSGSLSRQTEKVFQVMSDADHVASIGKLVEEMEIEIRSNIDALYIQKTHDAISSMQMPDRHLATASTSAAATPNTNHVMMLNQAVLGRMKK